MFPLLLMLDAIAANRQNAQPGQQAGAAAAASGEAAALMALPAMSSDRAAEAALACLLQVVRRCSFQTGDSLLSMLRRLASILEIPRDAASEEIRLQVRLLRMSCNQCSPLCRPHAHRASLPYGVCRHCSAWAQ
jgi:hypothetical protein